MTTQTTPTTPPRSATLRAPGRQKYISLTTFRRTGAPVATPVWFVRLEDTLYFYSDATAGKVKRIRNNPQVQFAVCTQRGQVKGTTITGIARFVTDSQEQARAQAALETKYWLARRLLGLFYRALRLLPGNKVEAEILYLAVMPVLP